MLYLLSTFHCKYVANTHLYCNLYICTYINKNRVVFKSPLDFHHLCVCGCVFCLWKTSQYCEEFLKHSKLTYKCTHECDITDIYICQIVFSFYIYPYMQYHYYYFNSVNFHVYMYINFEEWTSMYKCTSQMSARLGEHVCFV